MGYVAWERITDPVIERITDPAPIRRGGGGRTRGRS